MILGCTGSKRYRRAILPLAHALLPVFHAQEEIAELETRRRRLERVEKACKSGGKTPARTKTRLTPDPFAAGVGPAAQQPRVDGLQEVRMDSARYTADGYRLAEPRKPRKPVDKEFSTSDSHGGDGRAEQQGSTTDLTADVHEEEFRWDEGFEDMEKAVERGDAGIEEELAGGYPKRLSSVMSFCRVSTKATCEVLVALGRVTVNGKTVTDPFVKVDILKDQIVCEGMTEKDRRNPSSACTFCIADLDGFASSRCFQRCERTVVIVPSRKT